MSVAVPSPVPSPSSVAVVAIPSPSPTPTPTSKGPITRLSADRLHELALEGFRIGNRGRLSLCEALRVFSETRLFFDLGYPSLASYANAFFQLRRSEAFEYVRVARAMVELTLLRDAFAEGRLGWSALKAITRVATADSQSTWIDFARANGIESTLAEARDARRNGRDAPRESSFGLPNLDQKLVLRYSRSDMERIRTWIEHASAEVAERTGAEEVSVEQAVLFLCERPASACAKSARDADHPRAQVVYQCCPDCSRARVGTREGFVEVDLQELDRYEGSAEPIVVDGPTPPGLRRRILAREAGRCGNPRCTDLASHCHHIIFRSRGGRTRLENEVAVCTSCHALIHAGLLKVDGDANRGLRWSPVADPLHVGTVTAADCKAAGQLPVLRFDGTRRKSKGRRSESAITDSRVADPDPDELATGLVRLGVSATRSKKLIRAALAILPAGERTESKVLKTAIASMSAPRNEATPQ